MQQTVATRTIKKRNMGPPEVLGQIFGKWTVLSITRKSGRMACLCRCECGTERVTRWTYLKDGRSLSCGCDRLGSFKHGETSRKGHSIEHMIWHAMIQRCENPHNKDFKYYGARGIFVCERWHSYEKFLEDMGRRPSRELQIDRKNNDGPYSPDNCRWSTRLENIHNSRSYKGGRKNEQRISG